MAEQPKNNRPPGIKPQQRGPKPSSAGRAFRQIAKEKKEFVRQSHDPTYTEMKYSNSASIATYKRRLLDTLKQEGATGSMEAMLAVAGYKTLNDLDRSFQNSSTRQRQNMIIDYLGDSWAQVAPIVMGAVQQYGPDVLNWIWTHAKSGNIPYSKQIVNFGKSTVGSAIRHGLNQFKGVNLNDFPSDSFSMIPSQGQTTSIEADEQHDSFDSVSTSAICTVLFPELYSSRLPLNCDQTKTGIMSGKATLCSVTTNALGNAIVNIIPSSIFNQSNAGWQMVEVKNDATLNILTGAQTPAPTYFGGVRNSSVANVATYRLAGFSLNFLKTQAVLDQAGIMYVVAYDNVIGNFSTTSRQIGLNDGQLAPYFVQSSLAGTVGHRAIINPFCAEKFEGFTEIQGSGTNVAAKVDNERNDYGFTVIFAGCKPGLVMNITCNYVIEWTATAAGAGMINYDHHPIAPATPAAAAYLMKAQPNLRFIGQQEVMEYTKILRTTPSYYRNVIQTSSFQYVPHFTDATNVSTSAQQGAQVQKNMVYDTNLGDMAEVATQ